MKAFKIQKPVHCTNKSRSGLSRFWNWVKRGDSGKYTEINRYIDRLIVQEKIPIISDEESWKKIKELLKTEFDTIFLPSIQNSYEYNDLNGNPDRPDKILIEVSFWLSQTINRLIKDNKSTIPIALDNKNFYNEQKKRIIKYQMQKDNNKSKIYLTNNEVSDSEKVRRFMKQRVRDKSFKKLKEYPGLHIPYFKTDNSPFNMNKVTVDDIVDLFDNKTAGPDPIGIYYSIFRDLDFLHPYLALWFDILLHKNHTWDVMKKAPSINNLCKEWRHTLVFMQSKKMDPTLLRTISNYRPICLMLIIIRSFNRLISKRTITYLKDNNILNDDLQKGMKGGFKGVFESILLSRELLQDSYNTQTPLSMCFLDIQNAYGSVTYPFLDYVMRLYEIPRNVRDYILGYYLYSTAHIYMGNDMTRPFEWRRGLFQGCSLSNCLFMMVMNVLFSHIDFKFSETMGYKIKGATVFMSAYLDDLVIMTHLTQNLQIVLNELTKLFKWAGFRLNPKKTQFLDMNQSKSISLYLNKKKVTSISDQDFVYLGVSMNRNLDLEQKKAAKRLAETVRQKFKNLDEMKIKLGKKENIIPRPLSRKDKLKLYSVYIAPSIRWQFINRIHDPIYRNIVEEVENEYLEKWTVQVHTDEKKEIIKHKIERRNELVDLHIQLMYQCSTDTRINKLNVARFGHIMDEDIKKLKDRMAHLYKSHNTNDSDLVNLTTYTEIDINPLENTDKNRQFKNIDEKFSKFLLVLGDEDCLNFTNKNNKNHDLDGHESNNDNNDNNNDKLETEV